MGVASFRQVSYAVWEAMAAGWDARHAYFEATAQPVTQRMLERLGPARGQTLLELAAGTGVVGFAAAALVRPTGRVLVSDFSSAMVEAAKRHAARVGLANVECLVLDAEPLDVGDDAVDGVLCRWGYMLMADPAAALRETRRVLRRGGRLVCAVFATPDESPWAALPTGVLRDRGHMPPAEARAPGIFALVHPRPSPHALRERGLHRPEHRGSQLRVSVRRRGRLLGVPHRCGRRDCDGARSARRRRASTGSRRDARSPARVRGARRDRAAGRLARCDVRRLTDDPVRTSDTDT